MRSYAKWWIPRSENLEVHYPFYSSKPPSHLTLNCNSTPMRSGSKKDNQIKTCVKIPLLTVSTDELQLRSFSYQIRKLFASTSLLYRSPHWSEICTVEVLMMTKYYISERSLLSAIKICFLGSEKKKTNLKIEF